MLPEHRWPTQQHCTWTYPVDTQRTDAAALLTCCFNYTTCSCCWSRLQWKLCGAWIHHHHFLRLTAVWFWGDELLEIFALLQLLVKDVKNHWVRIRLPNISLMMVWPPRGGATGKGKKWRVRQLLTFPWHVQWPVGAQSVLLYTTINMEQRKRNYASFHFSEAVTLWLSASGALYQIEGSVNILWSLS